MEYKETEIFELFPKFFYTPQQRKRVVLFHGYAKNYRKLIRYASNFDEPNKICLVYLVGAIKAGAIERELESVGCSDRVCVITAEFPAEEMEVWARYDRLRKSYKGIGWDSEKDEPTERLLDEKKRLYEYYSKNMQDAMEGQLGMTGAAEDYELCQRSVSGYREFTGTIERYKKLRSRCGRTYFRNFRLHRRGCLEKPYTHERLDELIKRVFPLGAEAMGASKYASLSPGSISSAVAWAEDGTEDKKLGLKAEMILPAVNAIAGAIRREIDERGFCRLEAIRETVASPPYGLGYDGFSAACTIKALEKFRNRTLIYYDGVSHFSLREIKERAIFDVLFSPMQTRRQRRRHEDACVYLESHPHKKVKQFMSELWGVKIEMPGARMGLEVSRFLRGTHNVPLAYADERLLRLTLWNVDFWDRKQLEALSSEISEHGEEIKRNYERYKTMNSNIPANAMTLLGAEYSWAWNGEEYERILWQTEKYGPWPWTQEIQNAAMAEERRRRIGYTEYVGTSLQLVRRGDKES